MADATPNRPCPTCGHPIPAEAPQGLCPHCVLLSATGSTESGLPRLTPDDIPTLARVAQAFPHLEITAWIGQGGMGFVYKARQPKLNRCVALKLLPERLARDPHFAERFHREGETLARLAHPNIVTVFDFGESGGFCFLLMEYIDGVNLRQAMNAGRFSPAEALSIVPQICEALHYAHQQGVMHRDIKPENILLDARGGVKIADFGIAKLMHEEMGKAALTQTGGTLGSPHYMAPEQLEQPSQVDHRADIYSLGVVFYEMLTGELPLGRFAAPSEKTPVSRSVDEVVFRTLEKERHRRFQTVEELGNKIKTLSQAETTQDPRDMSANARSAAPLRRGAWLWALASAALTALSLQLPLWLALSRRLRFDEAWVLRGDRLHPILVWVFLPGLIGNLLGWFSLARLRQGSTTPLGVSLATFGALTWPILLLLGASLAPAQMLPPPSADHPAWLLAGRVLMLILPVATLTFIFWMIYATVRWTHGQRPAEPHQRGILRWIFLGLLLAGTGWLVVRHQATQGKRQEALAAAQRYKALASLSEDNERITLEAWKQFEHQLVLRSFKPLPWGDYLVTRIQYPDGRSEDLDLSLWTARREDGSFELTASAQWLPVDWGSHNFEGIATERQEQLEGRVFRLKRGEFLPVYQATTPTGGRVIVSLGRLGDPTLLNGVLPVVHLPLRSSLASRELVRVSVLPIEGFHLAPEAVGTVDRQETVPTETRWNRGQADDQFQWTLPARFGQLEASEIVSQLNRLIDLGARVVLEPGSRVSLFSVTNASGSIFEGSVQAPPLME